MPRALVYPLVLLVVAGALAGAYFAFAPAPPEIGPKPPSSFKNGFILPLSVGDNGASSSKRPRFDLNLPIASEPEPEPASTSDPKEGVARNRTQEFPSEVLVFSFLLLL